MVRSNRASGCSSICTNDCQTTSASVTQCQRGSVLPIYSLACSASLSFCLIFLQDIFSLIQYEISRSYWFVLFFIFREKHQIPNNLQFACLMLSQNCFLKLYSCSANQMLVKFFFLFVNASSFIYVSFDRPA